ncbi:MAG: PEP-CTERM sorting domain-containing protein [Desulfobacterales bacterium]|nr:PEP-CTERM sorting domain-containing protein [Desulfobacterales bacterium]
MKRIVLSLCAALMLSLLVNPSSALAALTVLEDSGQKVVYDDINSKYWYWDVYEWANLTYDEQINKISTDLAGGYYQGTTGWHMATAEEKTMWWAWDYADIVNTFGLQYGGNTTSGRIDVVSSTGHESPYIDDTSKRWGWIDDNVTRDSLGAWVVTDAPAAVPVPSALILVSTGIVSLSTVRRRRNCQSASK